MFRNTNKNEKCTATLTHSVKIYLLNLKQHVNNPAWDKYGVGLFFNTNVPRHIKILREQLQNISDDNNESEAQQIFKNIKQTIDDIELVPFGYDEDTAPTNRDPYVNSFYSKLKYDFQSLEEQIVNQAVSLNCAITPRPYSPHDSL